MSAANPFDAFDTPARPAVGGNAFDQFHSAAAAKGSGNAFDQFDSAPSANDLPDSVRALAPAPKPPAESLIGDAGRAIEHGGIDLLRTGAMGAAGLVQAATLGHASTDVTDPIFRAADKLRDYGETIPRPTSAKGRVAEAVGGLIAGIPSLGLGNLSEGQDVIANGGTVQDAVKRTALNAAGDIAGVGLGALGGATRDARVARQAVGNAALGEASRVAGNAISAPDQQRAFDPLDLAINTGAGIGFGLLPHGAPTRAVPHPDAQPGSLSDAANALHETTTPAAAGTAPPVETAAPTLQPPSGPLGRVAGASVARRAAKGAALEAPTVADVAGATTQTQAAPDGQAAPTGDSVAARDQAPLAMDAAGQGAPGPQGDGADAAQVAGDDRRTAPPVAPDNAIDPNGARTPEPSDAAVARARTDLDKRMRALEQLLGDQPVPETVQQHVAELVARAHDVPPETLQSTSRINAPPSVKDSASARGYAGARDEQLQQPQASTASETGRVTQPTVPAFGSPNDVAPITQTRGDEVLGSTDAAQRNGADNPFDRFDARPAPGDRLGSADTGPKAVRENLTKPSIRTENESAKARVENVVDSNESDAAVDGETSTKHNIYSETADSGAQSATPFPKITDQEVVHSGPTGFALRKVAPGRPLHRETNAGGLDDLLRDDGNFHPHTSFVTDDPALAIGQGANKGVAVTFRPDSVSGSENAKPGTGVVGGREYQTDALAPRAISAVRFASDTELNATRKLTRATLGREFDRTDVPDGSIRFVRKGLDGTSDAPGNASATAALTPVEAAARDSAAHPDNPRPEPTPAQHAANNFKQGHVDLHGLDITIQVPKDGMRRGTDAKGEAWERAASDHYGHVRQSDGGDGEPHDVYLGPHAEDPNAKVFVIRQVKPGTNRFDESKAMIGYASGREARKSYDANFPKGLKLFGGIEEMSIDAFKRSIGKGDAGAPPGVEPGIGDAEHTRAAMVDDIAARLYKNVGNEIGWEQVGGRLLRGEARPNDGALPPVVGRTPWVGKPGLLGESNLWRMRPDKINERQAHKALERAASGHKLTVREQRFVDYARDSARKDAEYQVQAEELEADTAAAKHQDAIARLREEDGIDVAPADAHEAMTIAALMERGKTAGIDPLDMIEMVSSPRIDYAGKLWRQVLEKERTNGTDTGTTQGDRTGSAETRRRGQAAAGERQPERLEPLESSDELGNRAATARQKGIKRLLSKGVREEVDARSTRLDVGDAATAGLNDREIDSPTHLEDAARAWREQKTDSPFFKRWFAGSKAVDAAGEPLHLYHGTGEDFTAFDPSRAGLSGEHATAPLGHFFTTDRALAKRYAENAAEGRPANERVFDAHLAIRKPYTLLLAEAQAIDTPADARALRAKLEREGYDGIRMPEAKSWIAFQGEQIKSVDNRGTFDPANPDILYSRASVVEGSPQSPGLPVENVRRVANDFLKGYKGHVPLEVRIGKTLKEIYGPGSAAELGNAKGAYHAKSRLLTLAADRLSSRADVITTLRHEVLGHYGLNTLAPLDKRAVLDAIVEARAESTLRPTWEKIDRLYADKPELVRAEEVFADLAGQKRGALGEAWDRILALVHKGLRSIGLVRGGVTRAELQDMARRIGEGIRNGERVQRTFPADDQSQFGHAAGAPDTPSAILRAPLLARRDEPAIAGGGHLTDDQRTALEKIGTFARGVALPDKLRKLTEGWRSKLVQGVVDQFAPLKNLDRDAYMQARLSRGTDGALEATFLHGTPKLTDGALDVAADGKGLRGILADLKGEHDLFLAWVAGHRASRLAAEDREHLFSPSEIRSLQALDRGAMADGRDRSTTYKATLAEFNRYQNAVLDIGQRAGLFTAKSRQQWTHEFYVPFFRDHGKEPLPAGAKDPAQFAEPGTEKVIQALKGGTQPLGDLLSNTLDNWSHILTASMRNMAASKALFAAERMGVAHTIEKAASDSVRVMRDGAPVHYEVSDRPVLDALTMLNFDGESNKATRVLGTFKRALSFGVTINPAFRVRNLLRDTISAMAVSDVGTNPLRNLVDGWRATDTGSATFHKLLASGGAVRFGALNDGEQAAHAKRLIALGMKDGQILDSAGKIKNALNHAWEWWKDVGDRVETVNRAVIYDRARAAGANHLEAAYQARDLLDFTMGGKWAATQFLVHTVPFLNARIQGLYKLGRGARENPMRFASVTGAVALASAATYLLQKDDPDFKALPDWARDTYWCVKLGDKMLFLPKPFEIGAMGSVVERGTELATAGNDYQAGDFARSLLRVAVDQLSMNPVPQAVKPAAEAFFNYDTFQGRPIDSLGQQRLPGEDRYTARTSAPAIGMGKLTGASPQRIEHLVRGYFGWLGMQALSVADLVSRPFTDLPSNPNRDAYSVSNWPLAGDFVKSTAGMSSKYVDRFYANQQQTEQLYAAYSAARKAGDLERARDLAGDDAVRLRTLHSGMNRQMQAINQRIRRATSDRSLDATDKRVLLDGLNQQRNRIAERADTRLRELAQ